MWGEPPNRLSVIYSAAKLNARCTIRHVQRIVRVITMPMRWRNGYESAPINCAVFRPGAMHNSPQSQLANSLQ